MEIALAEFKEREDARTITIHGIFSYRVHSSTQLRLATNLYRVLFTTRYIMGPTLYRVYISTWYFSAPGIHINRVA